MELAGQPGRAFYPEDNGMPSYSELVFIVKKGHQQDTRFSRFLTALRRAEAYLNNHPEESWQAFANAHPESNDELNHRAWIATLPYFARDPAVVNVKQFMQFAEFMQENGLIKNVQPISNYIAVKE
jgi:putative hydroxymethylpyrimidine transport system substrate-binding protein